MTSSRRKGKRELEIAALLRDLGTAVVRNLTDARHGGHDLIGLPGWSAEVKRASKPRLPGWWRQAVTQTGEAKPALFYRVDRGAPACGDRVRGRGATSKHVRASPRYSHKSLYIRRLTCLMPSVFIHPEKVRASFRRSGRGRTPPPLVRPGPPAA